MSRAYAVEEARGEAEWSREDAAAAGLLGLTALLPGIDMANHPLAAASLPYAVRAARGGVALWAEQRYEAGAEVWSSYGDKAPDDLLVFFGFRPRGPAPA